MQCGALAALMISLNENTQIEQRHVNVTPFRPKRDGLIRIQKILDVLNNVLP